MAKPRSNQPADDDTLKAGPTLEVVAAAVAATDERLDDLAKTVGARLTEFEAELEALHGDAVIVGSGDSHPGQFDLYSAAVGIREMHTLRQLGWTLIRAEFQVHDVSGPGAGGRRIRQVVPVSLFGRNSAEHEDVDAAREAAESHGEATLQQLRVDVTEDEAADADPTPATDPPQPQPIGSRPPTGSAQGFETHGIR